MARVVQQQASLVAKDGKGLLEADPVFGEISRRLGWIPCEFQVGHACNVCTVYVPRKVGWGGLTTHKSAAGHHPNARANVRSTGRSLEPLPERSGAAFGLSAA